MSATARILDQAQQELDAGAPQMAHSLARAVLMEEPDNQRAKDILAQAAVTYPTLPQAHQPSFASFAMPQPSGVYKAPVAGGVVIGGAIAVGIGSLLPWVTVRTGIFEQSMNGIQGDGILTIGIAIFALIAGIGLLLKANMTARLLAFSMSIITALVGLPSLLKVLVLRSDTIALNGTAPMGLTPTATVGVGLWLVLVGAIIIFIGAFLQPNPNYQSTASSKFLSALSSHVGRWL